MASVDALETSDGAARKIAQAATTRGISRRGCCIGFRDVAFLFYLVIQVNKRELMERRANCLQLMLVIERLHSFLRNQPLAGPRHEHWLEFVETLASRVFALSGAADLIGARYLGGHSPLLPDASENLNWLVAQLEGMIELYNDRRLEDEELRPKRGRKSGAPIHLEALRKEASRGAATALVRGLVTTAKTEALLMMGERKQAFSLMGESLEIN